MHDYLIDSARTAAPTFHDEIVPLDLLLGVIRQRLNTNLNVDACKKSLFYGRDLPDQLEDLKQQAIEPNGFDYTVAPNYIHAILGIDTEAAELLEHLRDALVFGTEIDRAQLINEAGDLLWYLAVLFRELDISFEEVGDLNLAKLRKRYPDKFDSALALRRNTAEEDQVFTTH